MGVKIETMNVSLPQSMKLEIEELVSTGEFTSCSEVVHAALSEFFEARQEHAARVAWLKAKVQEGLDAADRGEVEEIEDIDQFMADVQRRLEERIASGEVTTYEERKRREREAKRQEREAKKAAAPAVKPRIRDL